MNPTVVILIIVPCVAHLYCINSTEQPQPAGRRAPRPFYFIVSYIRLSGGVDEYTMRIIFISLSTFGNTAYYMYFRKARAVHQQARFRGFGDLVPLQNTATHFPLLLHQIFH